LRHPPILSLTTTGSSSFHA
jgi:hypothetical protein